jgi:hypothetical protein
MINYMQSNENLINDKKIIKNELWDTVISSIKENDLKYNIEQINDLSSEYNIEKRNILKNMLNYIIRYKKEYVNTKLLDITENIMHISDCNQDILVNYSILQMKQIL